jgi:hypothetical protein
MQMPIRRQDRKLDDAESLSILTSGEYGILSLVTTDNGGYGIPLNYVLWNNSIYFHCALEGSKLNFIKAGNKVSFCVVGKTELMPSKFGTKYESVIISGKAEEINDAEKKDALLQIVKKYSPDYIQEGIQYIEKFIDKTKIIKIPVEQMTGKSRKS